MRAMLETIVVIVAAGASFAAGCIFIGAGSPDPLAIIVGIVCIACSGILGFCGRSIFTE